MRHLVKYLLILITLASIGAVIYGFVILEEQPRNGHRFIGFGTAGLFLIAMPMFLIRAGKGKNVKDYMLTQENLRKMQGKEPNDPENHKN